MIKYWVKLLTNTDGSLPTKMYQMLREDADSGNSYNGNNWACHIKSLLDSLGLSYVWLQQNEIEIPISLIKQRLFDIYFQSWYSDINNSNRLLTYARFKHEFTCEKNLDFISNEKYRFALTRFRLSSHELEIERGRYENKPMIERICKCCNMNMVENEYHFALVCPLLYRVTKKIFQRIFLPLA